MPKISLPALIDKIQRRKITEAEVKRYFSARPNPLKPFDFKTYINPDTVDTTNFEALARDADRILESVVVVERGRKARARAKAKAAAGQLVADGDSWFKLPPVLYPKTLINHLQTDGYQVTNLAHWGDELDEVLNNGEFWPAIAGPCDTLLFSAGGNDLIGNGGLANFIRLFDVHHNQVSDAWWYILPTFEDNLSLLIERIEVDLAAPISRMRGKRVLMHGYDYAIPRPGGYWLGSAFEYQGFDIQLRRYLELAKAIVRIMIDKYNAKLGSLAAKYPHSIVHVNLRNTLGANEWVDELHATTPGSRKLANRYRRAIDDVSVSDAEEVERSLYSFAA